MRGRAACLFLLAGLSLGCTAGETKGEPARAVAKPAALQSASGNSADAAARLSARLAPRLSQTAANLTPVARSDGRRSVRVNGGFSQAQLARLGADGRLTTACVDNLAAAERMIDGATP